ncbi:glutamyl-tRNA(Gln) amidotransferase subunit A [Colletotrichum acutatum]
MRSPFLSAQKPTAVASSRLSDWLHKTGVIPECEHQDTVGTFGRTVRDAVYALDAIYDNDPRDNYSQAQIGKTPISGGYAHFWAIANEETKAQLGSLINLIQENGGTIINGTEITNHVTVVNKAGWDWNWQGKIGHPEKSEYTVVLVDFDNNIKKYLSELQNTKMRSLEDIIKFNYENDGTEGGVYHGLPAFRSGQDGFLMSNETQGDRNDTYWQALNYMQNTTRGGIDAAQSHNGKRLSGLLVPISVAQTYQIAAQAGYPMITIPAGVYSDTGMPFGLGIMQTAFAEKELNATEVVEAPGKAHSHRPGAEGREPKGN